MSGGRDAAATFSCRNAVFRCADAAASVKKENGERGSFVDTELGGENLSAAVVDDCPHVCTNHPYTADESCGIKEEAYISCTLISSMG